MVAVVVADLRIDVNIVASLVTSVVQFVSYLMK